MQLRSEPILLEHRVDLYVPSQCLCGQPIPAGLREAALMDVKSAFDRWFGGHSEAPIKGDWALPGGSIAKEEVSDIFSFCSEDALQQHAGDVDELARNLANRLTQDRVLRVFDNLSVALWPNTLKNLKPKKNCSCQGGSSALTGGVAQAVGIHQADRLSKMLIIQGILRSFSSADHGRKLFCDVLNYRYSSGQLPVTGWPDTVRALLDSQPSLLAEHNGFKIVYLRLAAESLRGGAERQVIQRICRDDPTFRGLFVVSDKAGKSWEFLNIKAREDGTQRLSLRRMRVGIDGVRTATERLAGVEIAESEEASISAEGIQTRHDTAFDVEAVTKSFFTEVASWYFWALKNVTFPKDAPKEEDGHDHVSVIRLITRLIFCWFVREKGLIPSHLFDEKKLAGLLEGFAPDRASNKESVYYKAILQNLFFATLNTEMDKRGWARDDQNFMAHSLYRYKDLFTKPSEALALFKTIPFLNGGLFECLDKDLGEGSRPRYIRIDGFSRRADSQPTVPDFLFFGKERELDLSEEYGDSSFRKVKVRGLIHTLDHYRFTVEESTPLEEEVALDPELAGKIFENLLATYNPETGATARKQTGSFYTPREIVNYMVDEAIIAYLDERLGASSPASADVEDRLRHLFSYENEGHRFTAKEVELLIAGIDQMKALDPAVGSGAFPMGILHKLVFTLGRLDPRNEQWKERQKARLREAVEAAERVEDGGIRERTLRELDQQMTGVDEAFERNALDFGRKLYLIENCLYGVDIQPIAVQIAKMRFFISLIADQRVDPSADNLGVRPLPNLETKLVAANTLIGIEKPAQMLLRNPKIDALEADLRRIRERHFLARTLTSKAKCRDQDERLRGEIADLLKKDGWDDRTARRLSDWDPYDQNSSAGFFDPEWMFGIVNGFDVVMGNPPYVRIQVLNQEDPQQVLYFSEHYTSAGSGNYDLYVIFVERGLQLTAEQGHLAYILPHKFFNARYGEPLRELISKRRYLRHVVHFGDQQIFPGATNYVCLLFLAKAGVEQVRWSDVRDLPRWLAGRETAEEEVFPVARLTSTEWNVSVGSAAAPLDRLRKMSVTLEDFSEKIFQGLATSADSVFVLQRLSTRGNMTRLYSKSLDRNVEIESSILYPLLKGSEVRRFEQPHAVLRVLFPYRIVNGQALAFNETQLRRECPAAFEYLKSNKQALLQRSKTDASNWWLYPYPKNLALYCQPKIVIQVLSTMGTCFLDTRGEYYFLGGGTAGGNAIKVRGNDQPSFKFLLGILNSKVASYWVSHVASRFRGGYYAFGKSSLKTLPLPTLNGRVNIDEILVRLVDRVHSAKQSSGGNTDTTGLEREIDERVYRLYGLTKDEIKIVEEGH